MSESFLLDGVEVPFETGDTLIQAAQRAGHYIAHLCWHPDYTAHGSCKLCTVKVGGRWATACTTPAAQGLEVQSQTTELSNQRRTLLQLLFVEGNHFCPACEKSGSCTLQATAYREGMLAPHFDHFFPSRPIDASHPEVLLDFNRCIMCELCVRASRESDGKDVFALSGRGTHSHLVVNSPTGLLKHTDFSAGDRAAQVCPVGVILRKGEGFKVPIGQRLYDQSPIGMPNTDQKGGTHD